MIIFVAHALTAIYISIFIFYHLLCPFLCFIYLLQICVIWCSIYNYFVVHRVSSCMNLFIIVYVVQWIEMHFHEQDSCSVALGGRLALPYHHRSSCKSIIFALITSVFQLMAWASVAAIACTPYLINTYWRRCSSPSRDTISMLVWFCCFSCWL